MGEREKEIWRNGGEEKREDRGRGEKNGQERAAKIAKVAALFFFFFLEGSESETRKKKKAVVLCVWGWEKTGGKKRKIQKIKNEK